MSSLLSRRSENTLVGYRMSLLASQKPSTDKNSSPTLLDLRNRKISRVKKFAEIYEKQPWMEKVSECNWWLNDLVTPVTPGSAKPKTAKPFVFPKVAPKFDGAGKMKQLLKIERDYVNRLREVVTDLENSCRQISCESHFKIQEAETCVFGGLRAVFDLHVKVIYPKLIIRARYSGDCVSFIESLGEWIDEGHFYCHVTHKMLESNMIRYQNEFFIAKPTFDSLKIIEHIHNWISNVSNELLKSPDHNEIVTKCAKIERKLIELMDVVAEAEEVTKISQISNVPIDVQMKLAGIARRQVGEEEAEAPKLFLVPNKHLLFGYRYPLDIIQLGKFVKSFKFSMLSKEHGYMHDAKYFVFEQCVIYANIYCGGRSYGYENHFWIKDVNTNKLFNGRNIAELHNCNHTLYVDSEEMIEVLRKLKRDHSEDENTAEIDLSDRDLMIFAASVE